MPDPHATPHHVPEFLRRVQVVNDEPRPAEPTRQAKNRVEKAKKPETCPVCENAGVVELKGVTVAHGTVYSRGSAPCRWCEVGAALALHLESLVGDQRVDRPLAYRWDDVIVCGADQRWQLELVDAKVEEWRQRREDAKAARSHAVSKEGRGDAVDG